MKFTRLVVSLLALGMPFSSFAASLTPQQLLDRSYSSWNLQTSNASTFQFEMKGWTTYVRTPVYRAPEYEVKFNMFSEEFPRTGGLSDGTVRFQLPYLKFKQGTELYELRNPVTFEARVVGMDAYFRVAALSDQVRGYMSALTQEQRDKVNSLVGQWVHVNLNELASQQGMSNLSELNVQNAETRAKYVALLNELKAAKVVKVTGVEKRYRGADGHQMVRVRAALNPKIVDVLWGWAEREGLNNVLPAPSGLKSGLGITPAEKAKALKEAKAMLAQVKMAAVLDQTDGSLDRVEVAISHTEPTYTYKWVKNKEIKLREGTSHVNVNIGVELRPIANRDIEVPTGSISLEELMTRLDMRSPTIEPEPEPTAPVEPMDDSSATSQIYPQNLTERDHITGNPQGRVTMVVYSDFECPFCERFQATVKQAMREFPNDVRVVYRNYPLSFHPYAQPAAEAAECASRVGGSIAYWTMHDAIFAQNPSGFSDTTWVTLARNQGLNEPAFQACMNNHETATKIQLDIQAGNESGVEGTPATFINGKMVSGAVPYETLRAELVAAGAQY